MISYKAKKNRSKRNKVKKQIKQFCKVMLVASCGFMPFHRSFAQSTIQLGTNAGANATAVDSIVAIGVNAGRFNQGSRHIFIGTNAGYNIDYTPTSPIGNGNPSSAYEGSSIFIGYYAGYHTKPTTVSNARENIFIGEQAGYRNTRGTDNIFIGSFSGHSNTTASDNIFIGLRAGGNNTTGNDNTFIGEEAGFFNISGDDNTFIGEDAGYKNTTADDNSFFGSTAGRNNTTGNRNTFVGAESGYHNTTGDRNTALGDSSLYDNSTGRYNTALGQASGASNEYASYNTFIGAYAGWDNNRTNVNNSNNAWRNTYVGAWAGFTNREGIDNTGMGCRADFNSTSISNSVFIGSYASLNANGVTIIGKSSVGNGENGIAIGHESSVTAANSIAIGYQASVSSANEVQIGNAAITSIGGFVNWTATSDGRFKTDVKENVVGLDFINQLRPVTYQFDSETILAHQGKSIPQDLDSALIAKDEIRYTGFIAQEVDQAAQQTGFEFSGIDKPQDGNDTDYYGIRYAEFVVPLVKATQELSQKVETLEKENATQKDLLAKYEAALESALIRLESMENQKREVANQ